MERNAKRPVATLTSVRKTTFSGMHKRWNQRMVSNFPCCFPYGKAGGLQILRCQVFAVDDYSCTLDVLALEPSDFCNIGVNKETFP